MESQILSEYDSPEFVFCSVRSVSSKRFSSIPGEISLLASIPSLFVFARNGANVSLEGPRRKRSRSMRSLSEIRPICEVQVVK